MGENQIKRKKKKKRVYATFPSTKDSKPEIIHCADSGGGKKERKKERNYNQKQKGGGGGGGAGL